RALAALSRGSARGTGGFFSGGGGRRRAAGPGRKDGWGAAGRGETGRVFSLFGRGAWVSAGRHKFKLPRCGTRLLCDRSLPDRAHVLTHAAMTARRRDYDVLAEGIVVGRIMKAAAGGHPVAVDAGLWPPRGPHADLRLRANTRGCDGGVR